MFGYERHRESLEIHPICECGELLYGGAVGITKGYTRASILAFGVIQTLKMEDEATLTEEEIDYFSRWLESTCSGLAWG